MTSLERKTWFAKVWYYASLCFVVSVLVAIPWYSVGPVAAKIEMAFIAPLRSFEVVEFECIDPQDGIARLAFNKQLYPGDLVAEYQGMTIRDTTDAQHLLAWRRANEQDMSSVNHPAGKGVSVILIEDGCHTPFTVDIEYISPLTGNRLFMHFPEEGAFNEPDTWQAIPVDPQP